MKKTVVLAILLLSLASTYAQDLSFFLPKGNFTYNKDIPTPKQFFGHELGQQHATYDMAIAYLRLLAEKSDRMKIEERGRTYQYRPILFVYISSSENIANLNTIQQNQQKLCNYKESDKLNLKDMPIVVWLGYSTHGNEASGINASLAVAYFLAAAQAVEVDLILSNSVVVVQPGANPDGVQRYASWVNSARSFTPVKDQYSREFREPIPSSRSNHYWFDLNRDWLFVQHPESYYRSQVLYEWHPTVFNDYHEHGSVNGSYFSPGKKTSNNPAIPADNWDMAARIAQYHVKYMNSIGSLYFSKEGYDDWYTGKGAALPDLLGSIGILYEQPNSRGHITERNGVVIRFTDMIQNQAYCSYSAISAAVDMKEDLQNYQRKKYTEAHEESLKAAVKAYVFGNPQNKSLDVEFFKILKSHNIDVYQLNKDVMLTGGKTFKSSSSFIVPCSQQEYRVIRTIFETQYSYIDSTFYDVSTWTIPLGFSMNYGELSSTAGLLGSRIESINQSSFQSPKQASYAYLFEVNDFYSYKFLYKILDQGVKVRVGNAPFSLTIDEKLYSFDYGTLVIPVKGQPFDEAKLHEVIAECSKNIPVGVVASSTGWGDPFDLGSRHFKEISLPRIALIWGTGAAHDGVGEIWHLLDQRMNIPAALVDGYTVNNVDLSRYNIIVLNGNFRFDKQTVEKLKAWAGYGSNMIIGIDQAYNMLNEIGLAKINTLKRASNSNKKTYVDFFEMSKRDPNSVISGVILENYLDQSHPIAYGMSSNTINTFRETTTIISKPTGQYMSPVYYTKKPLLSGCITPKNLSILAETPSVLASSKAIYFVDDPCFRGYWFGSTRLLLNSFFFRELMPSTKITTAEEKQSLSPNNHLP